ncbi:hypothetical protein D9M68_683840 [compost metagenome]
MLAGGLRHIVDRAVLGQVVQAFWLAVLAQVRRAGAGDLLQAGDAFADQRRVAQRARAQDAIHAFLNQIDEAVGLAQRKLDVGVAGEKLRQRRDHEVLRQGAVQIHAQQPLGRHRAERLLGLLQLRQQLHAARVIGLAIQGRANPSGAALKQAGAKPGFELIEGVGQRRPRQVQVFGGEGEAAALVDAHEDLHGFDLIHRRRSVR